jgi:hypothetical protein
METPSVTREQGEARGAPINSAVLNGMEPRLANHTHVIVSLKMET